MTSNSINRLELAKKVTRKFLNDKNVRAVIVTGSVGKGIADEYSDIDIVIYRNNNLSKAEFNRMKEEAVNSGGGLISPYSEEGFTLYHFIDGFKCDFAFITVNSLETIFRKVFEEFSTEATEHQVISGFLNSTVICNDDWINEWKKKLSDFPPGLSEMMILHNMGLFHNIWEVENHAVKRNDDLLFYELMTKSLSRIINVLCGLNRISFPGKMKGIIHTVEMMNIKPDTLERCINDLYTGDKKTVLNEFTKLVEYTLKLTEEYMPAVDTTRSRKLLYLKLS